MTIKKSKDRKRWNMSTSRRRNMSRRSRKTRTNRKKKSISFQRFFSMILLDVFMISGIEKRAHVLANTCFTRVVE